MQDLELLKEMVRANNKAMKELAKHIIRDDMNSPSFSEANREVGRTQKEIDDYFFTHKIIDINTLDLE